MPDEIRRIDYYYVAVPDKPGEGSRILTALRDAGINLLGVSAFPHGARRSQLDLIPEDGSAFAKAAKAAGKNCVRLFAPEMQASAHDRLLLERDLYHALAQEEFALVYQPIFDLQTTEVTGVEFSDAWPKRVGSTFFGVPVFFISLGDLISNKRALGRSSDLKDLKQHPKGAKPEE